MKEYKVLVAASPQQLEEQINEVVKEVTQGWELLPETLKIHANNYIVLFER